jgi:hypothetical protein
MIDHAVHGDLLPTCHRTASDPLGVIPSRKRFLTPLCFGEVKLLQFT